MWGPLGSHLASTTIASPKSSLPVVELFNGGASITSSSSVTAPPPLFAMLRHASHVFRSVFSTPLTRHAYRYHCHRQLVTPSVTSSLPSASQPPPLPPSDNGVVDTVLGIKLDAASYNANLLNALSLDNASAAEVRAVRKRDIVERFRRSESDTGSPEVQIALMTMKIKDLTAHMVKHRQDKMKKRTMTMAVGQRRRMMQYLLRISPERYLTLVKELGLRPNSVFPKPALGAKKKPVLKFTDEDIARATSTQQ